MTNIATGQEAEQLFSALGEQLAQAGASFELVVVGGSGLLALGLIDRATRDVDIVALRTGDQLHGARPLAPALVAARDRVARDFGIDEDWLNPGPTDLLDLGLPEGFIERLQPRSYGSFLTIHYASRLDQVHFKLYALVDRGAGKHEQDLRALNPTREELLAAARWTRTHDPSPGFRQMLIRALVALGVRDVDLDA